ncbi:hypothetical protein B0H14DRAFT_1624958 [Mycena olivaceomarginata]|nr:hypothetical protein B0H14DRAFT_1624958 [Mycena olivaceomarginata]
MEDVSVPTYFNAASRSGLGPWIQVRAGSSKSGLPFMTSSSFEPASRQPLRPVVSAEYIQEALDNPYQLSTRSFNALVSRGLPSKTPIIAGVISGTIALISLACLLWLFFRRRKEIQDKERAIDVVSRPFPLPVKRPRLAPIITALPIPPPQPAHKGVGVTPRRTRRKAPPPPTQPPPAPPSQHAGAAKKTKDRTRGRTRRASPGRGLRLHLPPISEGYGVGLGVGPMTRDAGPAQPPPYHELNGKAKARRSSISKSILNLRWGLPPPPVSQGYGVGLG